MARADYPKRSSTLFRGADGRRHARPCSTCVGAKKAIVAGLSLGGYMSLAFNASHPDRVRALMLFDTGPGFKKDEARAKWNETAQQARRRLRRAGASPRSIPATRSSSRAIATPPASPAPARGMLAQQNDRVIQSLDKVAVPTPRAGRRQRHQLPRRHRLHGGQDQGATKVVIPDAGHAANLHQPARFNQAVEAFLAKLPAA